MTMVLAICVGVIFAVSIYLMLGAELKGVAMGVFLLSHAANLSIIAMSRSPWHGRSAELAEHAVYPNPPKGPPLITDAVREGEAAATSLGLIVDPLPQALILTAIVIGFAVMCFLLTLIVQTGRATHTLSIDRLAEEDC